jgi:signal transduction histidine kinase
LAIVEVIARMHEAVAARDTLLSVVSHDLKAPLSNVSLREQRLLRRLEKEPQAIQLDEIRRHGDAILKLVGRLSFMIENLLDLGRIHSNRLQLAPTDADFAQIVRDVIERLRPVLEEEGYSIQTSGVDEPCLGLWDVLAVERIVGNLLSNAIKYGGGKPITVSVEKDAERVQCVVADHGIGIAPDEQPRVFERFEKATGGRGKRESHGLGLWIVRRLVRAHGGRIALDSRVGEGTRITVTIPRGPRGVSPRWGPVSAS